MGLHNRQAGARWARIAARRPAGLLAIALGSALLAIALGSALIRGGDAGEGAGIVTHAPAAVELPAPVEGTVRGLGAVAGQIRSGAVQTERAAGRLEGEARGYLTLTQTGGDGVRALRRRERATRAMLATLARVQAAYGPLDAFVAATPALAPYDLGADTASANARPDDSAQPLTQMVALLDQGATLPDQGVTPLDQGATLPNQGATPPDQDASRSTDGAQIAGTPLPAGPTLLAAATALHGRSARLEVAAATAKPTAATLREALAGGLAALRDYVQTWIAAPAEPASEAARARATLAGLLAAVRSVSGHSTAAVALSSLAPGLRFLGELLSIQGAGAEPRALLGQEISSQAADLAAEAQRGDGAPGPRAAAVREIEETLFRARLALVHGQRSTAVDAVSHARLVLARDLAPAAALSGGERFLREAASAARRGEARTLALATGHTLAALMTAAYELTLSSVEAHRPAAAGAWAAVRDFGPSASGAIGGDALQAVDALAAGALNPAQTALVVRRDELDRFQRRTVALVGAATLAGEEGHWPSAAQDAAQAGGYWELLAPIYNLRLGASAGEAATAAFAQLSPPPALNGATTGTALTAAARLRLDEASATASAALGSFTAAPATGAEQEQRVRQLVEAMRFTAARLCGPTTAAAPGIGLPGTVAGPPQVARLIDDLRPSLDGAQRASLDGSVLALAALPGAVGISGEEAPPPSAAQPSASVRANCAIASAGVRAVFPGAWARIDDDGDFNRIEQQLELAETDAAAGRWEAAGAAARDAYAIFDLTPELRLRAVDPELATRIEVLFWNGGASGGALFEALAEHAPPAALHARRAALEQALLQAHAVLDSAHDTAAAVVNSAIVVFREGLEALLIVAALGASFVSTGSRWRRPIVAGALAAVPVTVLTWVLAGALLGSFVGYGLQLQAVLDVLALAVLAAMLAWFFQKFCWTRFVAREHARHRRLLGRAQSRGGLGPALGLAAVGFTIVYREGFETVLFLQALRVEAGAGAVVEGVLLGAVFTAAIAVLMLRLRRRLPYRGMVIATAALVGVLTVAMTGQAARALQTAGWLAIAPVHVDLSEAAGLWLGLYPTAQSLLAQLGAALAIVLGAVLSERLRTRRLARRVAAARAARVAAVGRRLRESETDAKNTAPTAFY
jgi:high-affinity iron transporter